MINYTPENQLSLNLFKHPFETELDSSNRWVELATLIPWDQLASVYASKLESNSGRKTVDIRHVLGAMIVKHKFNLGDIETIKMIQENIYLQYFCGLKSFTTKPLFDPSLFVDIRKRLGGDEFEKFNKFVIDKSEQIKPHQARIQSTNKNKDDDNSGSTYDTNNTQHSKQKGILKVDATVADQEIKYPTDIDLLNTSRENLEKMIDKLYDKEIDDVKPRTYRRVARKQFLNISKKKKKSRKLIRKGLRSQLQYVARDLKAVNDFLKNKDRAKRLSKQDKVILETIKEIYEQQKWMYENKKNKHPDRIVSVFQPHVRPILRGKAKNKTEFGSKINISEVNGFTRIDRLSWDAYNESKDLIQQVENYVDVYDCYPKELLADSIYLTRENRKYLNDKNIKIYGKPLGRPPKIKKTSSEKYRDRKKENQRNHVEGKFGQAKRGYGMNCIKARLAETSESWVNAIIFITNLTSLLKVANKYGFFFLVIFKMLKKEFKFFNILVWEIFYSYKVRIFA